MTPLVIRRRIVVLFFFFALGVFALGGRLFFLQILQGELYQQQALEQRLREIYIQPSRGTIYDREGRKLAFDISVDSVVANPVQVTEKELTAQLLGEILNLEQEELIAKLSSNSSFEWIQRKIDSDVAQRIRELDLDGIYLVEETKRYYPEGAVAAHVIGFAGIDNQGLEGIEVTYDNLLRGSLGRVLGEATAIGTDIPDGFKKYIPSRDGHNLILTIDKVSQYIVERQLDQIMLEYQPKSAVIIVTNPRTGEVLAMGVRPTYDPNTPLATPDNWRNLAIWYNYEPGSTFKIVTAAAALEEGVVSASDSFFCSGAITVAGSSIGCVSAHGSQSLAEVVKNSCNVGFVTIGQRLGKDAFYRYIEGFGFGKPTGISLTGEEGGILLPRSRVGPVELANNAFGHGIAVTPIQMISMVGAIANDGVLLQPQIVREIYDHEGNLVQGYTPKPVGQVVSRQTARELAGYLQQVVADGTGRGAAVEGYNLAGKTGTAQKIINGHYASDKHVASFVGFGPVEDPQLAVLVVVDEPKGAYYGGLVAAPAFQAVMAESLPYLGIPPTEKPKEEEQVYVTVPNVVNLPLGEAEAILGETGLSHRREGEGTLVVDQIPRAGAKIAGGSEVILYLWDGEELPLEQEDGEVLVPNLQGKTIREVAETLSDLGLLLKPEGTGLAVAQDPEPLTLVPLGTMVEVRFAPPSAD
ncbi:MAG TPA: PASTA domain-containing protein [Firmicutes bacterium]|nr:PASTA domain-containing protein [Bacillota bacterium]